jgi:translin
MIDKDDFGKIIEILEQEEKERENIISISRKVLRDSKVAIYNIHRENMDFAFNSLNNLKKEIDLLKSNKQNIGMKEAAFQEYVEAFSFYYFIKEKRLITLVESSASHTNYLLGLCDLTGELMRFTVNSAIKEKYDVIEEVRELIFLIYGEFLKMDLSNGELRKKSDSIKWNLNKVDDIIFTLKTKDRISLTEFSE